MKLLTEKHAAVMGERKRISADMHDDLGSDLSKIALLSEVLKINAGKNGFGEQLNSIAESAQDALLRIEEIIWSLNPKNDDLKNLIAYMRQKIAEQFENTTIVCMINMPDEIPQCIISGEQRRNIFLVVNEACHNIVKHARATQVSISFSCNNNWFKIIISDNGRHCP
ncbi:MAG: ATP-binding protein [Bacteroidetes bacterium]|nr:ATP-binding protein [Bacteroidota bacterium]